MCYTTNDRVGVYTYLHTCSVMCTRSINVIEQGVPF